MIGSGQDDLQKALEGLEQLTRELEKMETVSEEFSLGIQSIPDDVLDEAYSAAVNEAKESFFTKDDPKGQAFLKKMTDFAGPILPETEIEPLLSQPQPKKGSVLILTSAGGSGHKEAATDSENKIAKAGKYLSEKVFVLPDEPAPSTPKKSQAKSWMLGDDFLARTSLLSKLRVDVGKGGVKKWNKAQKEGDMKKVKKMVASQWISELLFGRNFHVKAFAKITEIDSNPKKSPLQEVIDTQAVNSHQIVKAVAQFNRIRSDKRKCQRYNAIVKVNNFVRKIPAFRIYASRKYVHPIEYKKNAEKVYITKRMTDLPNNADHFFLSLQKISPKDLAYFKLEAPHAPPPPSPPSRQGDLAYYQTKCPNLFDENGNPKIADISFTDGPIRQEFLERKQNPVPKDKDLNLNIKVANSNELNMLKESGVVTGDEVSTPLDDKKPNEAQTVKLTIPAHAKVQSIMLGSQAAIEGTLAYVNAEIEAKKRNPQDKSVQYLFVFCGKHEGINETLFKQLNDKISQETLPEGLKIIPLTFQDATMISSLYSRADEAFIRSGGISCMEIEAVSQGKVYIHSEEKGDNLSEQQLLDNMLFWEQGNAQHVQQVLGKDETGAPRVQITNPEMYRKLKVEGPPPTPDDRYRGIAKFLERYNTENDKIKKSVAHTPAQIKEILKHREKDYQKYINSSDPQIQKIVQNMKEKAGVKEKKKPSRPL